MVTRQKKVAVTSYDQQLDITLETVNEDFHYNGNSAGPSTGCGKDLGSLKSGSYNISSAGLSRDYIIDIPANYDKIHPYRLIFGMHCHGRTMQGVANDKYYQLKRFADSTKTYCIFVAPNGTGSATTPLWNQEAKDHTFFDDMVKLFKEKLCVDTTRIISVGFSYGAMFSFSLSTNHQKVLRAVACYMHQPIGISGSQPTHTNRSPL
jgi:poly(3-hydroxybutyrate) depolymerase